MSGLDLGAILADHLPGRSDRTSVVTCTIERILMPEDLSEYVQVARSRGLCPEKVDEDDLTKLRARHHAVAKYLATGLYSEGMIAGLTGYTATTISKLKNSPAMHELVAHYRADSNAAHQVVQERLNTVAMRAVEKLEERLDDEKGLDDNSLIQLAKLGLDRSGHGPTSKVQQEHTMLVSTEELQELNRTARRMERAKIVDPSQVRMALPAPVEIEE